MLPFLDEARVRAVLRMEELIPAVERALVAFSAGRLAQGVRQMLTVEPHGGHFGAMPAAGEVGMGVKLVTFYPGSAERGLPTHLAMILLFRPETGEPLAVMDGRLITDAHRRRLGRGHQGVGRAGCRGAGRPRDRGAGAGAQIGRAHV